MPGPRGGRITVSYGASGSNWALSVGDDGVGIPKEGQDAKAGLGTTIVKAIAAPLDSTISVSGNTPGTLVTLTSTAADVAEVKGLRGRDHPSDRW
jgi:two-component sensor histidine kinase